MTTIRSLSENLSVIRKSERYQILFFLIWALSENLSVIRKSERYQKIWALSDKSDRLILKVCIMCPSLCSLSISFKILFGSLFSFPWCCARHQLYAIICGARLFAFAVLDLLQKAYGLLLWLLYQSGWSKNSKIPNIHVYVHICICIHTHLYANEHKLYFHYLWIARSL